MRLGGAAQSETGFDARGAKFTFPVLETAFKKIVKMTAKPQPGAFHVHARRHTFCVAGTSNRKIHFPL